MSELIYLYEPRTYCPEIAFRNFSDALALLLKDEAYASLDELAQHLDENDVWYDFDVDNCTISISAGARIEEIELR